MISWIRAAGREGRDEVALSGVGAAVPTKVLRVL